MLSILNRMGESKITIKKPADIKILREGGKRLSYILGQVANIVRPGIKQTELNELAEKLIFEGGDKPAFKNYRPHGAKIAFPSALCVSVNDEVVHGIPVDTELLEGDIVSLDIGLEHKGLFTDMSITVPVGNIDDGAKKLIEVTKKSLEIGIKEVRDGAKIGNIGYAIEKFVKQYGFGIVRELAGHGVGYSIHEPPYVPNFGKKNAGLTLKEGMVIAIEPMVNEGGDHIYEAPDKWTIKTKDGTRSAHFEKTVLITKNGAEVLTPFPF
ncbi:MAG: Methionine aminopeptidase [Parcubacteria group bacterium GW2011_GWF2_38_76]|nr:MAG: Methionine aminopeptidase [Parcubacteria group bacterium GW2011_GWF2_38_76]